MAETIHAGCIVVGEAGLLIRGASGAGKSTLAREILFHANQAGLFRRLVSDDRTRIEVRHGRLVARPVEPLVGCMEVRGVGIIRQPFEPAALIRLIIDLCDDPPRYPKEQDAYINVCGVTLPRMQGQNGGFLADMALDRLSCVCDTVMTL
jgi:HPr kinase/phosphorylase